MRVDRDSFHNAIVTVNDALGASDPQDAADETAREALRGIVIYVMSLENALDRADNARREAFYASALPNPWSHVRDEAARHE